MRRVDGRSVRSGRRLAVAAIVCVALLGASACSSNKSKHAAPAVTTTTRAAPVRTIADMSRELTGGKGVFMGEATPPDLQQARLRRARVRRGGHGDVVQGCRRADATTAAGSSRPTAPRRTAPASLVRRAGGPDEVQRHGVVEWLNVSGGVDADPDWTSLHEEIVRAGRRVGRRVGPAHRGEGGPVLVKVRRPRRRDRRQGPQGDRSRALRLARSIPATATRSTSSRRSPAPCAPARV